MQTVETEGKGEEQGGVYGLNGQKYHVGVKISSAAVLGWGWGIGSDFIKFDVEIIVHIYILTACSTLVDSTR